MVKKSEENEYISLAEENLIKPKHEDIFMTKVFLSETDRQNNDTTVCVVCNKTYNEREQGWTYSSFLKLYTCSNECYSSEQFNQLLNEESSEKG